MNFKIQWFDQLPSTNSYMHDQMRSGMFLQNRTIFVARDQTEGRGRQQRKWLSKPNQSLCFSLFLQTSADIISIPSLSMSIALAIDDFLRQHQISSSPKWPNDVLVGDKKISGILAERVAINTTCRGIIVGVGLNVNMTYEDFQFIDRPTTSLLIETGQKQEISNVLNALLAPLDARIKQWEEGGFKAFREEWTKKAGPLEKNLTVHDGEIIKSGQLAGFGEHGELQLKTANGIETIWSGDVS